MLMLMMQLEVALQAIIATSSHYGSTLVTSPKSSTYTESDMEPKMDVHSGTPPMIGINISSIIDSPWLVAGDFNQISEPSDKLGGKNPNILPWSTFFFFFLQYGTYGLAETLNFSKTNMHP